MIKELILMLTAGYVVGFAQPNKSEETIETMMKDLEPVCRSIFNYDPAEECDTLTYKIIGKPQDFSVYKTLLKKDTVKFKYDIEGLYFVKDNGMDVKDLGRLIPLENSIILADPCDDDESRGLVNVMSGKDMHSGFKLCEYDYNYDMEFRSLRTDGKFYLVVLFKREADIDNIMEKLNTPQMITNGRSASSTNKTIYMGQ